MVPTPDHNTTSVPCFLCTHFDTPLWILSVSGLEFMGSLWKQLEEFQGCTPYHLEGNLIMESLHHTINDLIHVTQALCLTTPCADIVPAVQLTLN